MIRQTLAAALACLLAATTHAQRLTPAQAANLQRAAEAMPKPVFSNWAAAQREADKTGKPMLVVAYDPRQNDFGGIGSAIETLLSHDETRHKVEEHFVRAIVPITDRNFPRSLRWEDEPHRCRLIVVYNGQALLNEPMSNRKFRAANNITEALERLRLQKERDARNAER